MKTYLLASGLLLACPVYAQLSTLPPSASPTFDLFDNRTQWGSQLHAVTAAGPANSPIEALAGADGISMGGTEPEVHPDLVGFRIIYLGNSAAVNLNLGYTFRFGTTEISRTLVEGTSSEPQAFTFWDIPMTAAMFGSFDLWLNVAPTAGGSGGLFHVFHPEWNQGTGATAHWSQEFGLNTTFWDAAAGALNVQPWETRLLAFEDAQQGGADSDRSDLVLGIQLYPSVGHPTLVTPGVPEPAAVARGGVGALVLTVFCTVFRRRFRKNGGA